jgi:hypothetical protein
MKIYSLLNQVPHHEDVLEEWRQITLKVDLGKTGCEGADWIK